MWWAWHIDERGAWLNRKTVEHCKYCCMMNEDNVSDLCEIFHYFWPMDGEYDIVAVWEIGMNGRMLFYIIDIIVWWWYDDVLAVLLLLVIIVYCCCLRYDCCWYCLCGGGHWRMTMIAVMVLLMILWGIMT